MSNDGQYPTQEQAATAAMHQLGKLGDSVYLHNGPGDLHDYEGKCWCDPVVVVLTDNGWRVVPPIELVKWAARAILDEEAAR